ncbi:protein ecdysoneless [Tribolium castaneum]|uniref:Protein SGT1 homolog ecdysoneless-like Protein n=1 Tax=Tribolium castaneum TaxID=7070 RepID=D6WF00_TRICA|nr:PREDICTED: protein ecdysoneless [Tribolium castaneum]EFA01447.1 Protein SGT1 homolog ecdysoneless-like Protein [Tribolium castaneum]|eukprot:XP_967648.1 PREDICTED: protein ecdysoneless [Tribolium castaneum]
MASKVNVLESVREDDFVEYHLFPPIDSQDDKEQELALTRVLNQCEKIVKRYTDEYLWHKDEFKLTVRTWISNSLIHDSEKTEYLPPHLYGVTHFGDNIEDEWFIVFLLRLLTKEIDGLIARVHDADGEFILIEAADYLPLWADPNNCENRVYIYQGNIHIIPLDTSDHLPEMAQMAVNEAVSTIQNNPIDTLASSDIQNCIINKLKDYPDKIQSSLHHATAYLPVGVAAILRHKPGLIAPAVQVFCNRDPVDAKTCKAMKYFPPENRVNARVTFTKCLYAMLTHSKYVPDRRTGWNLPKSDSPQFKAQNLGVKIACGFEILAAQAKPSQDIEQDKGWVNYFEKLKEKNYFRGLLEHSREYNDLLNKAKEYYINHRDSMHYSPAIGQEIVQLIKNLDFKIDELKEESNLPDDDDSWLNVSPEELDKMLEEKYGQKKFVTVNNNSDAASFTEKISSFLNHVSDIDGVEHPDLDNSPTRPPRGVKKRTKVSFASGTKTETTANNRVSFDPNAFSCAVQNILNFVIPEDDSWDLDSGSDMSDYADDVAGNEEMYEGVKNKMQEYMEQMDKELAATTIGESFEKKNGDGFEDIESFKPVDIDVNALKNILESYKSQLGEAGPSSNMLGPMGVHLDVSNNDD